MKTVPSPLVSTYSPKLQSEVAGVLVDTRKSTRPAPTIDGLRRRCALVASSEAVDVARRGACGEAPVLLPLLVLVLLVCPWCECTECCDCSLVDRSAASLPVRRTVPLRRVRRTGFSPSLPPVAPSWAADRAAALACTSASDARLPPSCSAAAMAGGTSAVPLRGRCSVPPLGCWSVFSTMLSSAEFTLFVLSALPVILYFE